MGYECLLTGLPDISADSFREEAPMTMAALDELLAESLKQADKEQLRLLKVHGRNGACQFILDWLDFNRDMNNILTAEVCRKHGLELKKHILGEMPDDVDPELKTISKIDNLFERERMLDAFRFAWLEERTRMVTFSLENVLAYYLMCEMLNRWTVLTAEKGEDVFRKMVAEMKKDVHLDA